MADSIKYPIKEIKKNRTVPESIKTTRNSGTADVFVPGTYPKIEQTPYEDNTNYWDMVFAKKNPYPYTDLDEEDRIRRVAKMQALGDLFKHLGNFAGLGNAPVEKRQDNARLYQTLAKSDAERARISALQIEYLKSQNKYSTDMDKFYNNMLQKRAKADQEYAYKQTDATDKAKRFNIEQKTKDWTTNKEYKYKTVTDTTKQYDNSDDANGGGGGGRGKSNSNVIFYDTKNNKRYSIPNGDANALIGEFIAQGKIEKIKNLSFYERVRKESSKWRTETQEWYAAMIEFLKSVSADPEAARLWNNLIEKNKRIKIDNISDDFEDIDSDYNDNLD